jgi:SAM-dependent methyltransferase
LIDLLNAKYPRLIPDFYCVGCGTDAEPGTTGWMASLIRPMGERFREGVRIIDYGCGYGRLFNFITGHLRDFHYYGAEPLGGRYLDTAISYFGMDPRATFLTCEEVVKSPEILKSDAVILGSVFTHLRPVTCEYILSTLWPIVTNGGMIIFSVMMKPGISFFQPGAYGFQDCYGQSFQTKEWIRSLETKFERPIDNYGKFECEGGFVHNIFCIDNDEILFHIDKQF